MIGRIITNWYLSKAAVIVQSLLEMHGKGTDLATKGGMIANRLVASVYDEAPSYFDGKEGQRPHKISLAATALAKGVKYPCQMPDTRTPAQRSKIMRAVATKNTSPEFPRKITGDVRVRLDGMLSGPPAAAPTAL